MKKTFILGLFAFAITLSASAQEEGRIVKKEMKSVRKEVRMEENNGVKTLTISTDENGKKTEEVYTGEEADKKLAELQASQGQAAEGKEEEIRKEVKMEEVDGKKKLTIITTKGDRESMEVYEGEEAEAKLKELEAEEPKRADQVIKKKEKTVIKKESM